MKRLMMCAAVLLAAAASASDDLKSRWENGGRAETLDWFRREMFGYAPERPSDQKFEKDAVSFAGGEIKIRINKVLPEGASAENPAPSFILLDHYHGETRPDGRWHFPDTPTNDIVSRGYAYININLNDVALNTYDETWSNRVHRIYGAGGADDWGLIAAWAWGVSRVMDWIERQPELDASRVGVIGHSRGGKAALWAAAQDERIALAVPNGSGTGGARLLSMDLPDAEPLEWMLGPIKFWFCGNLQKWFARTNKLEHDADDLIRLVCPRLVYVGSGSKDDWAGPRGEFESARRASDLWRAYGKRGLAVDQYPAPGGWSDEGCVGFMLRDGPHKLTSWNWARVLDFADRHLRRKPGEPVVPFKETAGRKAPPPRLPVATNPVSDGLHGRVLGLYDRVYPSNVKGFESPEPRLSLVGWKGERVHAQVVVWSDADQGELKFSASPLAAADGARLPENAFSARFMRTVHTQYRPDRMKYMLVGDCLDPEADRWPAEGYRVVWLTFDVPLNAAGGVYRGEASVAGEAGRFSFKIDFRVVDRTLPAYKDRRFFLDLWQHPWSVSDYYRVKPFSEEHFARLQPVYRELARAGQRVILTSIVDLPWGESYSPNGGEIRSMVDYVYKPKRGYVADFTLFDRYVEFAKKCGLGPQIHCYTVVKFNSKHIFYYTDGATGERRALELYEGSKAYEQFLTPLLVQLQKHLEEKGWLDEAYIAIDEVAPERLKVVREFLRRVAPKLKFALASNVDPMRYKEIDPDVDVMSQILWKGGHGITNIFNAAYDSFRAKRRERGQITTFYVCTEPQKPNTWLESPLAETAWIGLYAGAKEYDGFLRWAAFLWQKDPWNYTGGDLASMPAGEVQLLYPGALASPRWEILRDSIEDWEKIRLLREDGAISPELQSAMNELDWDAVNADSADVTRRKVEAVQNLLNR
ncbi:MAG: DUF4091 domain-containing protein [Kiritimatiellae bacterium]|nr:DUF4091 domain-containing protein [Kiritimatiellia bacterium]